jgi:hypothetical protein
MKRIPWIVVIVTFMVVCATFSFAADPKACVKNNAAVILEVGQSSFSNPILLGQSVKVHSDSRLILLCANFVGEYHRCLGADGQKEYYLRDGQTLEVMGTFSDIVTHITDNTCK